jgi:Uma2 family endonuclease
MKEPSPLYGHQKSLIKLLVQLYNFIEQNDLGEVLVAPMDVYADNENVFQPDIFFIAKENLSLIEKGWYP